MAPARRPSYPPGRATKHRSLEKDKVTPSQYTRWKNKEKIIVRRRRKETGHGIKVIAKWFEEKYHKFLPVSTAGEFLGKNNEWLDHVDQDNPPESKSNPQWPMMDKILLAWQLHQESQGKTTSRGELLEAALKIWSLLPEEGKINVHTKKLEEPMWSFGLIDKFKKRHKISSHAQHGEAGSVPASAFDAMVEVRAIADEYEPEDIYNMDESGLYWKRGPSRGLSTKSMPGPKASKARITFTLCCNADGSDRLPIHFIGKSAKPRSFGYEEKTTKEWIWANNKTAWMTTELMIAWLDMFYEHVGNRKVLLLMDNFSAHKCAVLYKPPPLNIRIQFLPPNSTSVFQPLDQGIIRNIKHYYLKSLLQFNLESFQFFADIERSFLTPPEDVLAEDDPCDDDPCEDVLAQDDLAQDVSSKDVLAEEPVPLTVKIAIWWLHRAWKVDVKLETIYNCWIKSTLIRRETQLEVVDLDENQREISQLYSEVVKAGNIKDPLSPEEFLHPEGEDVPPISETPTIDELVYYHLPVTAEDEVNEEPPIMELDAEALKKVAFHLRAFRSILDSACQRDNSSTRSLNQLLLVITRGRNAFLKQRTFNLMGGFLAASARSTGVPVLKKTPSQILNIQPPSLGMTPETSISVTEEEDSELEVLEA